MNEYLQLFRAYLNFEKGLSSNTLRLIPGTCASFCLPASAGHKTTDGNKKNRHCGLPGLDVGPGGCLFEYGPILIYFKNFLSVYDSGRIFGA